MVRGERLLMLACAVLTSAAVAVAPSRAAATAAELRREAAAALASLYRTQPAAKVLGERARAILVFPNMVKAGFMFGGQIGEGTLTKGGKTVAYYNSVGASYGLQAGAQKFGYALFFMNDAALRQLDATDGFEIGVGPSVVVVDEGVAKSITSNTVTSDVYAFIFSQKGLMAGLGIQGSKITRISK
jgi:lipid-binding SYLF domain-containing protein